MNLDNKPKRQVIAISTSPAVPVPNQKKKQVNFDKRERRAATQDYIMEEDPRLNIKTIEPSIIPTNVSCKVNLMAEDNETVKNDRASLDYLKRSTVVSRTKKIVNLNSLSDGIFPSK